eukprot:15265883-Alexandrium_andersonii.AAC.1
MCSEKSTRPPCQRPACTHCNIAVVGTSAFDGLARPPARKCPRPRCAGKHVVAEARCGSQRAS